MHPQYDNPKCVYEGKTILPLVLIDKRPIYKKEKPHCLAIDPCNLIQHDVDDTILVLSNTDRRVEAIFNKFAYQIGQENINYTNNELIIESDDDMTEIFNEFMNYVVALCNESN